MKRLHFMVHTARLLSEVMENPGTSILKVPLKILAATLADVASRAIEINDPDLNRLMCRLTLYEQADPESPSYDRITNAWATGDEDMPPQTLPPLPRWVS